jgi:hypothetical protein
MVDSCFGLSAFGNTTELLRIDHFRSSVAMGYTQST